MALSDPHDLRRWPDSPPPQRYNRVSDEVWDAAKDDYAGGFTAPEVCERHGVGLSNFRARARAEGFRRTDLPAQAGTDPGRPSFEEEAAADVGPMPSWREQANHARRTMNREQARGAVLQAQRWFRLWRDQNKEAEKEEAKAAQAERDAAAKARHDRDPLIRALRLSKQRLADLIAEDLPPLPPEDDDDAFEAEMREQAELERLDDLAEAKLHQVHAVSQPPQLAAEEAAQRPGGGEPFDPHTPPPPAEPVLGLVSGQSRGPAPLPQAGEAEPNLHEVHAEPPLLPPAPAAWGDLSPEALRRYWRDFG